MKMCNVSLFMLFHFFQVLCVIADVSAVSSKGGFCVCSTNPFIIIYSYKF